MAETKSKKRWLALGGVVALLLVASGGVYYWRMAKAREAARTVVDELPAFIEPGEGPRAPSTRFLGFDIGRMTLEQARAKIAQLRLDCRDTSVRALMRHAREVKIAQAEARGEDPDAVASASWNRPSPRERNPQVRMSCDDVNLHTLDPRYPDGLEGRFLLVFDSEALPLRHVSVRRSAPESEMRGALVDARMSATAMTEMLGEPAETRGALASDFVEPDGGEGAYPLVSGAYWRFADFEAEVSVTKIPGTITINEGIGVPTPIRPDAPARSATSDR